MRGWAHACARLIVPPGSSAEIARLLDLPRSALVELASGVELDLFRRQPLDRGQRLAHWRRWLVERPLGWDERSVPGSIAYQEGDLWPFREAEAILLYVGRYTAVKRLPLLIRAHAEAVARSVGDEQVFLAGWRPHQELPEALNAADLLVLPSVAEAFGLVLVEAMACGLAVIAADAHGPAEIVAPGTGWLVPADDQQALTDALLAAATDPQERSRRGECAHKRSRARYGWPVIAARIADIYERLADGREQRAARA
jgi:glycosyltransferase involved in cell wall biosynthesis